MHPVLSEAPTRPGGRGRLRSQWRWYGPQWKYCLAVLGPVCLAYLVIRIIPIFDTAWMSLHPGCLIPAHGQQIFGAKWNAMKRAAILP